MNPFKKFSVLMIAMAATMFSFPSLASKPVRDAGDGSWITVSGKVVSTAPRQFILDYGDGRILVEMDGWRWYDNEQRDVLNDKQVIVQGRVDDSWLERRSIEAGSVYVKGLHTYFYASSADEEGDAHIGTRSYLTPYQEGKWISLSGKVSRIDGRTVVLQTGQGKVRVDTSEMDYNPLDDSGYQQVEAGDKIVVNGPMDREFYRDKILKAMNLVTLHGES